MSETIHSVLTRRERQIVDVLYRLGKATVGEVIKELPGEPNYSTVRAQLGVLEEKGHVRHEEVGLRYVSYLRSFLDTQCGIPHCGDIVDTFFEGSTHKVVAALLGGETANVSDEDLNRISELVRKARKGKRR